MRTLKKVGAAVAALLVLGAGAMATKFYVLSPKLRPAVAMTAPTDAESVARGEYLARHVYVCTGCHSKVHDDLPGDPVVEDQLGVGRDFGDVPGFPGHIRAQNITSDKAAGIGGWTDGEIVRAMREGVDKSGRPLFPIMPYPTYATTMSDADALAVIAYIRTLPPSTNEVGAMQVDFPVSMFVRALPKPVEHALDAAPTSGEARGTWLLQACSCAECHTPTNARHDPLPGMYLAGGTRFIVPKGSVYVANITSDPETGIGNWTDDEIFAAIKTGVAKTKPNRALYAMPWPHYGGMTDDDLHALVTALRKVPPVKNAIPAAVLH